MRSRKRSGAARLESLLFGLLLLLLFLLPLPWGSNRSWIWLGEAALALAMLAAALWIPLSASARTVLNQSRPLLLALALWWLYGLLQILPVLSTGAISLDPFASLLTFLQSSFYCALFVLILRLACTRQRLTRMAYVMVLAGLLQAIYGALMTLSGVEWLVLERKTSGIGLATGTFVNRNHMAGFLVICLATGIGLLIAQMRSSPVGRTDFRKKLRDLLSWILSARMGLRLSLIVMVIALVLTHSRMGNMAFFASLLATSGLAMWVMKKPPRPLFWLLVSLIVIDIAMVGTWFGVEQVVDRLAETGRYDQLAQRYADKDRLDLSSETLQAWTDYRWFGSGGGTFEHLFSAYRPDDLAKWFDHAHNDYLELLLEYGIVGVAPLLAFVLLALRDAITAQRIRHDRLLRGVGFAVTMVIFAYAMHSTVDFNLHIPANAAFFMVALAMGVLARHVPSRHKS